MLFALCYYKELTDREVRRVWKRKALRCLGLRIESSHCPDRPHTMNSNMDESMRTQLRGVDVSGETAIAVSSEIQWSAAFPFSFWGRYVFPFSLFWRYVFPFPLMGLYSYSLARNTNF